MLRDITVTNGFNNTIIGKRLTIIIDGDEYNIQNDDGKFILSSSNEMIIKPKSNISIEIKNEK